MKKIININLASRLIPIEDTAYEILRQYLDSLKKYFAREEGADEIVSDIESRIAEIFQDKIKKGAHCITDEDVVAVKAVMGTPDQFEETEDTTSKQQHHAPADDAIYNSIRPRKRLYRDPDAKVLGGVCGGLGAYLNVDPVVFRIIFALLAIGGFGSGILVYFILWIVTPEATTAAEKLQMRGERVDVNNIKTAVQDEINAAKASFKNIGDEVRNFSQGRGKQVGNDLERFGRNLIDSLGPILGTLTKVILLILAIIVLFSLLAGGFAITVLSPAIIPLKSMMIAGTLQNLLFWPSLFLVLGVPAVGIIIFLVRKITGVKYNRYVSYTLSFLWFLGLFGTVLVCVSVGKDFRVRSTVKEKYDLVQPSDNKLVLKESDKLVEVDESFFDDDLRLAEDTVIINNYRVSIEKSRNDSFSIEIERSSRGRNYTQARSLAKEISFPLHQEGSVLFLPSGISIPRNSKFRNQRIRMIIRVPVNKQVDMDARIRDHYHNWNWEDEDWGDRHRWDRDGDEQTIKMTPDGVNDDEDNENSSPATSKDSIENNYRYKGKGQRDTTPVQDSVKSATPSVKGKVAFGAADAISYSFYKLLS